MPSQPVRYIRTREHTVRGIFKHTATKHCVSVDESYRMDIDNPLKASVPEGIPLGCEASRMRTRVNLNLGKGAELCGAYIVNKKTQFCRHCLKVTDGLGMLK